MNEPYTLRRSARKTISLRIDRDGSLIVSAPFFTSKNKIERFIEKEKDWIGKTRRKVLARPVFSDDPAEISRLKERANAVLPQKTAYYAEKMGLYPEKVRVGSAKTRFGCCTSKKHIVFSCYLMLYPDEAIDYVVVHELAHLRHMDHGKSFYELIASVLPDWKKRKALLNGPGQSKEGAESDGLLPKNTANG